MNNEDKIIQKLFEMDQKIDGLATKKELGTFRDEVLGTFDKQGLILQRLDQERLFTLERIKRIEDDVEKLKKHLQLA